MRRKNTILIVDDSRLNRASIADILKDRYDITESENGREAFEILKREWNTIALIILDLVMPMMDGFAFLEEFQKIEEYRYIPVVVATVNDDQENERRCLALGAWDFVPKSNHPEVLKFRVENAINKSQVRLLEFDSLTEIYSQQKFFQSTREMLDRAEADEKFAFIHFDIERFKVINATQGTQEGDRLICLMADAIRGAVEAYGSGRYGRITADVFGICIPYENLAEVQTLAKRIHRKVKEYSAHYYLETCAGIYPIESHDMEISSIFDNAAIAAGQCKGRYMMNTAVYTSELRERLLLEQRIIDEMDTALKEEQFIVYFQPKYELEQMSPYGAEALVRWKRPDGTLVSPGDFIPVFERNGFIIELDYYVWEKVCQFIKGELEAGREPAPISVNVSRVNLYNPKFLESVTNLIEKYKISPKYLHLELTESAFSDNAAIMREAVQYLHRVGFTILMDDFGSGYSSLNVLKDVDLDVLKIDMKFFSKGGTEEKRAKIIEAVIRMAESLNMTVIAEGVEEKNQVEFLSELGCDYIQGYYFAKPMPLSDYCRLIGIDRGQQA